MWINIPTSSVAGTGTARARAEMDMARRVETNFIIAVERNDS
jgi:hypothetical protein